MEESLRRAKRPQVISVKGVNQANRNSGPQISAGAVQKSGTSPMQPHLTKSQITPSLSEQKRRQISGNKLHHTHHSQHVQHQAAHYSSGSRSMIKDPLPQRVQALQNFVIEKVVCGSDQTFVITAPSDSDSSRHCFSWGCNSHGQLGHSFQMHASYGNKVTIQKQQTPTLVEGLEGVNVTHLSCGNSHAFAWNAVDQVVYGWGNGSNGRLGNEVEDIVAAPTVLECFHEGTEMGLLTIRDIACGENHSLALIDVDLGQIDETEDQSPGLQNTHDLEEIKPIEDSAARPNTNIKLTKLTRLFVWGCNEKKQLGLNSDLFDDMATDEAASGNDKSGPASSSNLGCQDVLVPNQLDPCPFETNEDGQVPIQIEAGYNYSGAVTADGVIYTWGNGNFGRLGYTDILKQPVPRQIDELKSHKITKLALGYYHAAAINRYGVVFSWGRGNSGQLGCGNVLNEDSLKPIHALADRFIIDVHCGESHSVALTRDGEVYAWGGGSMGQLGLGDSLRQSLPIKVSNLDNKVIQIGCGKRHSVAVALDGSLFTWGSNEYGQLGRRANMELYLKKQQISGSGATSSTGQNITSSAKTSPSMNLIQTTYQFYNQHKIPLSTDNQACMNRFEFPIANSGTSEDDESNNLTRLNRMAADSVNLSQSHSPHQTFTPINKLQEKDVSPYKEKFAKNVPKLELDSNSDSANQYYSKQGLGQHFPQTSQGPIPAKSGFVVMGAGSQYPQPQSATHQHNSTMFGMSVGVQEAGHFQQHHLAHHGQFSGGQASHLGGYHDGQKTPMTPGQISYMRNMQQDTTPKYIKNLRGELNVALMKNLELSRRLEQKEDELESDIQNRVISVGEKFSQQIKKADKTGSIDQAICEAFEVFDSFSGQQNLIRFVKSNLESTGSMRKEVLLQAALIQSLQSQASLQQLQQQRGALPEQ